MKVLVTGCSGRIGRATVNRLLAEGHTVLGIDTVPPAVKNYQFAVVDMTNYGQVVDAVVGLEKGIDAIVHMAAIVGAKVAPSTHIFNTNTAITYNVFQAARVAGVKNVVFASSETLLGCPFDAPPPYLPIDEKYASRPESSYALSKLVDEAVAQEFCRWDPNLKMVGLRFSWVKEPWQYPEFEAYDASPTIQKWNFWSYVDSRDCAQAVSLALTAKLTGFSTYIIAAEDTVMSKNNADLLREYYPDVPVRSAIRERECMLSTEAARTVLGFRPEYRWRDELAKLRAKS